MAWNTNPRNKYGAKKIEEDGQTFDSRKEFRRWRELKLLEQAGEISQLRRQVKYVLIPTQREPDVIGPKGGKKPGKLIERELSYVADFVYQDEWTGKTVVEDAKGMRTQEYKLKRKMMLFLLGIRIKET